MRIQLPAQINPPRLRKDGSASLSFDTRELNAEELMVIMGMRNSEGYLCYASNEDEIEIPEGKAEIGLKSPSERLKNVLYVWYKQEVEKNNYVGLFETFRKDRMESIIESIKTNKLK